MKRRLRYTGVWLETSGELGRVYSYYNHTKRHRVYIHVMSTYAGRINEALALKRARVNQHNIAWDAMVRDKPYKFRFDPANYSGMRGGGVGGASGSLIQGVGSAH